MSAGPQSSAWYQAAAASVLAVRKPATVAGPVRSSIGSSTSRCARLLLQQLQQVLLVMVMMVVTVLAAAVVVSLLSTHELTTSTPPLCYSDYLPCIECHC